MKRYREQQIVEPGWYLNPRHLAFRSIDEEKPLDGRPGEDYFRVPLLVTILVSPFVGLVYFMFLPLAGFIMLFSLLGKKLAGWVGSVAQSTARVLAPSWQPARAFLSTSRARRAHRGSRDDWAESTSRELGLESPPDGRHVHLTRRVMIHAPLDKAYSIAEDPQHWTDWFVGMSEPRRVEELTFHSRHPFVSVGTHFPLIESGCKDCREAGSAHWHSSGARPVETGTLGMSSILVLLPTEQDWKYTECDGDTEVCVEVDVRIPDEGWVKALNSDTVAALETECFDRTLDNLKRLCERTTDH